MRKKEKTECALLATRRYSFWPGKKAKNVVFMYISDIGIRGIYSSLVLPNSNN